jgi:hypothetical protein|tara:strand:- start:333 stop:653 length:321 start_codon:yes stop_codon:yes gene_type:complete
MADIKILTFKTNQTIIAQIEEKGDKYQIKKPVQLYSEMQKDGSSSVGFAPFLEFSAEFATGIDIPAESVLCLTTPVKEVLNQYNTVFGSGIQQASVTDLASIRDKK